MFALGFLYSESVLIFKAAAEVAAVSAAVASTIKMSAEVGSHLNDT